MDTEHGWSSQTQFPEKNELVYNPPVCIIMCHGWNTLCRDILSVAANSELRLITCISEMLMKLWFHLLSNNRQIMVCLIIVPVCSMNYLADWTWHSLPPYTTSSSCCGICYMKGNYLHTEDPVVAAELSTVTMIWSLLPLLPTYCPLFMSILLSFLKFRHTSSHSKCIVI